MRYLIVYIMFALLFVQKIDAAIENKKPKLLLIDTAGKQSYYYQNIHTLAQSVGFKSTYKNLYQMIEKPCIDNQHDMIACILSRSFLSTLNNPLTKHVLKPMMQESKKQKQTIALLFPDLHCEKHKNILIKTLALFNVLNKDNYNTVINGIRTTFKPAPRSYDTTLFPKQTSVAQKNSPLGFMIKNKQNNTLFFIGKTSDFNFSGIEENFRKNPINNKLRTRFLKSAQNAFHKMYVATTQKNIPSKNIQNPYSLPDHLTTAHIQKQKNMIDKQVHTSLTPSYDWIKTGISCAWLEQGDYFAANDKLNKIINKDKLLSNGIKFLYNAKFNLLWFEFVPEFYLSSHGRKKDQKKQYIQEVKKLAQKLKNHWKSKNTTPPKIFVGMNITSNYATHPVPHPLHNIYGQKYDKIPCPLDKKMWKTEVIDMFKIFHKKFANILPIDGIFFDFEMYHAPQQAGTYTDLMIFSDPAWHTYCKQIKNQKLCSIKTVNERITHLQQKKQLQKYVNVLEKRAQHIGTWLKQELKSIAPNIMFAAYAPTLPNSWFYRGILRGLSSQQEPVLYATFNTQYYQHHDWLTQNGIHLVHGAPIMLSKLKKEKDFNLIPYLKKQNNFVWYNRPSRMVYKYSEQELNKVYWGIEASPLKSDMVARSIKAYERK